MAASIPDLFPMTELSSVSCEWLWVYDGHVPVTEMWSKQIPVPAGVFFVIEGGGKLDMEGRIVKVPQGAAFFASPGIRRQWFAQGTRLLSVAFRVSWPDGKPLFSEGLNIAVGANASRTLKLATRKLYVAIHGRRREVMFREASQKTPLTVEAWSAREAAFREWLVVYVRTLAKLGVTPSQRRIEGDSRLQEMLRRLDQWPLDLALDTEVLAEAVKLSNRRVEQLLVDATGLTPHGYMNQRRLDEVKRRLVSEEGSLKELAFAVGFRHASHFTAWFKRLTGVTPGSYRSGSGQGAV